MARPINAALTISSGLAATENPGEYTFTGASFNNQADATNNGAGDVTTGFAVFLPAVDLNLGGNIPGVYHRYKLTVVTAVDSATLDGTLLWDEPGPEVDTPSGSCTAILAETTPNLGLAILPSEAVYSELPAGSSFMAHNIDVRTRLDGGGSGGSPGTYVKDSLTPNPSTGINQMTLTQTPLTPTRVTLWINGFRYWYGEDFTLSNKVLTWINGLFTPNQFDSVVVEYYS